jgi:hypothetical protein
MRRKQKYRGWCRLKKRKIEFKASKHVKCHAHQDEKVEED